MSLETITGRVTYLGAHTTDHHSVDYDNIELRSEDDSLTMLDRIMVPLISDRCLKIGRVISMSVLRSTDAKGKPAAMVLATYDHAERRTFFNEEMTKLRAQLVPLVLWGAAGTVLGLLMFVLPGLIVLAKTVQGYKKVRAFPTAQEIIAHVEALARIPAPQAL